MPSQRPKVDEFLADDYAEAREMAAAQTGLHLATFPVDCPYAVADLMNPGFLPPP